MRKFIFIILFAFSCISCSTGYVLHWKEDKFTILKEQNSTEEISPIAAQDGIIMSNDRTPIVRIDPQLPDGSAWVYYNLAIKNITTQKITINLKQIRIESNNEKASGVFENDIKNLEHYLLDAKTSYKIPVMFHLSEKLIKENKGSKPLKLILPLKEKGNLAMELWLWHV